jgi:threonylcarbamoyladenosine tRNA methylthiotransferase MtaB
VNVAFTTIGCKLNQADTDALRHTFEQQGHRITLDPTAADAHIVNTCTVTGRADRDCRKAIRRARRAAPDALIVVVGCLAQTDEDRLRAMPEVDWVVHRGAFEALPAALQRGTTPPAVAGPLGSLERRSVGDRARAQLVIQDGCERMCTYCKVPLARGPQRSLPADDVERACAELAAEGYPEIVLVGCNLGAWGEGSGEGSLAGLLTRLLRADLPRLRLSSVEPDTLTDELAEVIAGSHGRICPHLHIAQQSGSPIVLEAMGRGTDVASLERRIARLRDADPLFGIGFDLLVGFPAEDEPAFVETVRLVERTRPANLHVFPFSPREGTPAMALGDPVSPPEKKRRVRTVIDLGEALRGEWQGAHLGRCLRVVVDRSDGGRVSGIAETYARVSAEGREPIGTLAELTPTRVVNGELRAER